MISLVIIGVPAVSVTKRWHRPSAFALLLTLAGVGAFVWLGLWQLDRGREKDALLLAFRNAAAAPVTEFAAAKKLRDPTVYPHLRVSGKFDLQHVYLLDNQPRGSAIGVEVFVPFKVAGESHNLLVNRGWLPWPANRHELPELPVVPEGEVELHGIYAPISGGGIHLGGNSLPGQTRWPKLTIFIDADAIAADLGAVLLPRQLLLDADANSGFVREWIPTFMAPERHRAYAFQWFTFALVALVIFAKLHRR